MFCLRKKRSDGFAANLGRQWLLMAFTGQSGSFRGIAAKRNIAAFFSLSSSGRFLARVSGEVCGNVLLRKKTNIFWSEEKNAVWTLQEALSLEKYTNQGGF